MTNYKVKKGDTKFSLARRFGVSIAMLEQQNPHIRSMLETGQIISLGKTIEKDKTLTTPKQKSKTQNTKSYIVKAGDTKFSLAKRFNMSIAKLEEKNPHIVDMLITGHKLNIGHTDLASTDDEKSNTKTDTKEDTVAATDTDTDTDKSDTNSEEKIATTEAPTTAIDKVASVDTSKNSYKDYVIQPEETLYSLAKKAGMSKEAFTKLNPKLLTAVNSGAIIKMPKNPSKTSPNSEGGSLIDSTVRDNNDNTSLYSNFDNSATKGLYFYTPFSDKELSSPALREKLLTSNSNYKKYLEFFQGAQIAIDSALTLKLNFDISLIKESDIKSKLKIESDYKKNAILVPFMENSSGYPEIESNETVSVIDIESNMSSIKNSIVYKSIPDENFQKVKTLNYLAKKDAEVIVVSDLEEARNKDLILNTIPSAKFLTVDKAGFFKGNTLKKTLDKNKLNYIILDSEKTIVFLNSTTALMSKLSDYKIQLVIINASLIPEKNQVSDMRYRVLKLIFPAILDRKNTKSTIAFEDSYEKLFNQKPSEYAILGFDVTLDILLRLSQNSSFEDTIKTIPSEHSHIKFDYKKSSNTNYSNTGIYLMQYDSNEGLIELD